MPTTTDLRSHQPERSEVLTQCVNKVAQADLEPLPRYVVLVWGMNKKGQQIKAVITCATERMARCAAAAVLVELRSRAHFWIVHQ
jgi:hypothetical protein